ncbi:hypothetical protein [Lentzea sp. NPDC004782]|uniref:hypothetical protein n=1 Tax=Lentzea sp. NPDC004782 TaxID=3154458 RepID=UPI0033B14B5A
MSRPEPGSGAVLEQAALAAHHAAFEYADRSCAPDLSTALAAHTGDCPQRNELRSDDHVEPARHLAHACRSWADLRHALDDAQHACREAYAALSHLNAGPVPTRPGR